MSLLDWSPIPMIRTPRPDPCKAARQGRGDHAPPVAPARTFPGCLADHDALADAVAAYRATYGRRAYEVMRDAAMRCGMPAGEPPRAWSEARLRTYRDMMESAS